MANIDLYLCGNDECIRHKSKVLDGDKCNIDDVKHASYGKGVRNYKQCSECGRFTSEHYSIEEEFFLGEFLKQEKELQENKKDVPYIVSGVGEIHSRLSGDFKNLMQKISKGSPNNNMRNF